MRNTYETEQFLDEALDLDLVTRIKACSAEGATVHLTAELERFRPRLYSSYGTDYENLFLPVEPAGGAQIVLDFCTPEIFRFRFSTASKMPLTNIPPLAMDLSAENTPMVFGNFHHPPRVTCEEREGRFIIATDALQVEIDKDPWQMRVYARGAHAAGEEVFATRALRIPTVTPQRLINFDPSWNFHTRYAYPLGVARHENGVSQVFDSFDLRSDEHIYGFGERYLAVDARGQKLHLWNEEVYNNTSTGTYKSIPFFMSTRGYGVFINTSLPITARMGDLTATACSLVIDHAEMLDYYFIYGPTIKEILPRYTSITGKPSLPPKWSFGHWMGRITYDSQAQVEQVATELRQHGIPTDVIHIDTGWYSVLGNSDLLFDPVRFPDPAGMCARLKAMGFRVSLWQTCNTAVGNALYRELAPIKGLVRRQDGPIDNRPGYDDDCGLIDYSNPQVVAFMKAKFKGLFDLGVGVIKVDFGEGGPMDGIYYGYSAKAMHNLYALLYNRAVFEATEEHFGAGNGVIWARSAWAGSQRYPVHWSGDGVAAWHDLACTLRSGLSLGLSGFPFWSHDIGGFIGNPSPELYARWVQLGAFSSHARAHGEPPREPWHYGERTEAIYRQYMTLRYRLLPYLYTQSVRAVERSLPILRALVVDFQDDPNVTAIEDQYMFGEDILVAPILNLVNRRKVYLPPGEWVDYWSKQRESGGRWIDVEAPLEMLPMWVKAGAIIPMGPVQQYVDQLPLDPLSLELYAPGETGELAILDQFNEDVQVRYRLDGNQLHVKFTPRPGEVHLTVYGLRVLSASCQDVDLPLVDEAGHRTAIVRNCRSGEVIFRLG